jgi:hypothetical protein
MPNKDFMMKPRMRYPSPALRFKAVFKTISGKAAFVKPGLAANWRVQSNEAKVAAFWQ